MMARPQLGAERSLALALGIGATGGAVFAWLDMPLAWLIGAMCLTTASALAGAPVRVPKALRGAMIAVLGVMLGSAFTPGMFDRAGQWGASLSGLAVYVAIVAAVTTYYFRRVGRYDRTTAYFSGIPGGLAEMIVVGGTMGGDDRTIALTHASRILLVVLVIPFWFRLVEGYQPSPSAVGAPIATIAAFDLAVFAISAIAGVFGARLLKIPAPDLIGPMTLSAAAHLAGVTDSRPPTELIIIAQVVVGTGIGCRFAGVPVRRVLRAMLLAAGSTGLMLTMCVGFALALNAAAGLPVAALILAFSPGGLAEMSLIALALGIDPAFVSTHHVVRIFLVVVLAPAAFRLMTRLVARRAAGDEADDR